MTEKDTSERLCKMIDCNITVAFNCLCPFHAHAPTHLFGYVTSVLNRYRILKTQIVEARQLACYDPPITENEKNAVFAAVLFLAKRKKLPKGAVTTDRDSVIAQLDLSPSRNPNRIYIDADKSWYCVTWVAQAYENTLLEIAYKLAQEAYDRGDEVQGATKEANAPVYDKGKQTAFDKFGNRITKTLMFGGAQ